MQRLTRLMFIITLVVLASASFAGPNADTNLGAMTVLLTDGGSSSEGYFQEWSYAIQANEYVTCIAYYAVEDVRFSKKPSFTSTASGDRTGWSTNISPDRKAVYIFGPRTHFGPNLSSSYSISYIIYYDDSPTSQDTVIWDGTSQSSSWSRTGTPGNGGGGFWSYNSELLGGPYSPISTNWFSFGVSGTVNSLPGGAFVGQVMQVGPELFGQYPGSWGAIGSYSASPALPQVTTDLHKYGWGMYGTIDYFDPVSRTHVAAGNWRVYYTDIPDWPIEEGTFLIKTKWANGWTEPAVVTGKFTAQPGSTVVSPLWPVSYVDWATMGVAGFSGTFTNPDQLTDLLVLRTTNLCWRTRLTRTFCTFSPGNR
jgi:hypothetical protein